MVCWLFLDGDSDLAVSGDSTPPDETG